MKKVNRGINYFDPWSRCRFLEGGLLLAQSSGYGIIHLISKFNESVDGTGGFPFVSQFLIQRLIDPHIQHMSQMFRFSLIQRAFQGKAVGAGRTRLVINISPDYHLAAQQVLAEGHMADFATVTAYRYRELTAAGQLKI